MHSLASVSSAAIEHNVQPEPISMRIPAACRFTGLSRSTLYVLIAQGKIDVVKIGRATLILTASLKSLVMPHP